MIDVPAENGAKPMAGRASGAPLAAAMRMALAAAFLATAPAAAPRAAAEPPRPAASAIAARLERSGEKTLLLFELSAPVQVSAFPVARPDRIIVDLPEVAFMIDPALGRPWAGRSIDALVKSFRFGHFAPGRSRVIIDLARPAKVLRARSEDRAEGARLEIELAPTDAASFAAAAAERAPTPPPAAAAQTAAAAPTGKPVVVIDPGHGGVDQGATGKHGEQEKQIALDFARAVVAKIEEGGRYHAILTRTEDVFVPLDERVLFARRNNAALFLSIHADTLGAAHVEGATIYTVSATASDAESARVAEKENLADQAAGLERKEDAEEVGDILLDLARRETRAYSRQFAANLVSRWREAGSLNKNPSRSAGFVVLKAHDVPSVLLELGYLSSDRDLANLTSPQWRDRAAKTTVEAIEAYFVARDRQDGGATRSAAGSQRPH